MSKRNDDADRVFQSLARFLRESKEHGSNTLGAALWPFGFSDILMEAMIEFPKDVAGWEKTVAIADALQSAGDSPSVTAETLRKAVNESIRRQLSTPEKTYMLVTRLSVAPPSRPFVRTILGTRIEVSKAVSRKIGGADAEDMAKHYFGELRIASWAHVRAKVKAKSEAAAYQRAIGALNSLRGLLNHQILSAILTSDSHGPPRPISKLRNGPVQKIYLMPDYGASGTTWVELRHNFDPETHNLKNGWHGALKYVDSALDRLHRSSVREQVLEWFALYAEALDQADHVSAFQRLWTLLEIMTGASHDSQTLIRRAAWLFPEGDDFAVSMMLAARRVRNEIVHTAHQPDRARAYVFAIKVFVERLLRFFSASAYLMETIADGQRLLDMPKSRSDLHREILFRRTAMSVRNGKRVRRKLFSQ